MERGYAPKPPNLFFSHFTCDCYSDVEVVGTAPDRSIFGTNDDYRAAIRCITEKRLVLFLVTGNGEDSGRLQRILVDNFLNR